MKLKNDLRDSLKESITTAEIFEKYFGPVSGGRGRKYIQVECPNCHRKAFTLYEHSCKCFHCNVNGTMDIFSLYMYLNNTGDFQEALYSIARDFGIINQEDYDRYMSGHTKISKPLKVNLDVLAERKKLQEQKEKECPEAPLQSPEVIHNVYTIMKEILPVTNIQRQSLKKERGLSDERIDAEYFTMPYVDNKFYQKLFKVLKERFNYEPIDLIGVPGFFSYDKKNIEFVKRRGIGLLMSGANGIINGIQIRAYDKIDNKGNMILYDRFDENGNKVDRPKYFWCGSAGNPNGCGPGSPVDVIIPSDTEKMFKTCFITEGKFKEEKIVEEFNCPAISVQGVGNWIGKIAPEIKFISQNYKEIKHIYCAYDADMAFNFKVFNQCKNMVEEELVPLNVAPMIVVWDYHYGKGIDDAIANGHKNKLKAVNFYVYAELYERFRDKIMKLYPNSMETRILDKNKEKVDSESIYPIYKEMVLEPLRVNYL